MRGYLSVAGTTDTVASGISQKHFEPSLWLQHIFIMFILLFHEWNSRHCERFIARLGPDAIFPYMLFSSLLYSPYCTSLFGDEPLFMGFLRNNRNWKILLVAI
mgnify:CR=1 FL=1